MFSCFDGCKTLVQVSGIPEGVTDMGFCFNGCTNLTQTPIIPASVTDMHYCFSDCTSLKTIVLKCNYNPAKDSSNKPYFENAFDGCTALTAGGIKVPAAQLATYKANADDMGVTADKFADE